ncbi:RTA1-domain-containing protein [Hypoxylon sp. NC1633]|nr:RTA1-domain-containing protein [Hypoxylon sp. NC1633]
MTGSVDCTVSYCSRVFLIYRPSLPGNALFLAAFAVLIPLTLGLGIKYNSSIFSTTVATALALEVVGYIGRVLLYNNPTDRTDFILFLIGTIIGPTLICGAVFRVLPRIIAVYGEEFRSWRSVWYQYLFHAFTTVSTVLQLAGGLYSTIQDTPGELTSVEIDTGIHLLVAGLVIQLLALVIFVGHATLFTIAVRTRQHALDAKFAGIYNSWSFKAFLSAFSFATLLLILRTAYRVIVIAEGYESSIAQSDVLFLVLDGAMVLLATLSLLVFFPGRILRNSLAQTPIRTVSRTPLRPIQPAPYELPSARNSPTYNHMSVQTVPMNYSPRKSQQPSPLPQRNMVDSEALW